MFQQWDIRAYRRNRRLNASEVSFGYPLGATKLQAHRNVTQISFCVTLMIQCLHEIDVQVPTFPN